LLSLDFLYYINNALLAPVYLGLFASLRKVDFANMLIAVITGSIGRTKLSKGITEQLHNK